MKTYVPDREKWAKYFLGIADRKKPDMTIIKRSKLKRYIKAIDNNESTISQKDLLEIEPITPVQRVVERAEAELKRHRHVSDDDQSGGGTSRKKRRIIGRDTSGF